MAASKGFNGALLIGSDEAALIKGWDLTVTTADGDTSSLGNKDTTNIPLQRDVTANITGSFDISDTAQAALFALIVSGTAAAQVTVVLIYNNTTGSVAGWTGTATITNLTQGLAQDSVVNFTANAHFSGGITAYTT